jgi:hypothetical protein
MKIPDKVRICGVTFKVIEEERGKYGETDFVKSELNLRPTLGKGEKGDTFLHELIHVAISKSGLSERLESKDYRPTQEDIVTAICPILYGTLADNQISFREDEE